MSAPSQKRPPGSDDEPRGRSRFSLYELFVAYRILRARKRRSISVITLISVAGIILGVMALTTVMGVTGGFQDAFRERILGLYPHLVVIEQPGGDFDEYREVSARIRRVPGVNGASPSSYNEMLLANSERRSGVAVKGIDPQTVLAVSPIDALLDHGSVSDLDERPHFVWEGGALLLSSLVSGSSWTVALVADEPARPRVAMTADTYTSPPVGWCRLRVVNLLSDERQVELTLGQGVGLTALAEGTSRGVDVEAGSLSAQLEVMAGGERPLAMAIERELTRGDNHVLFVFEDAAGGLALRWMTDPPPERSLGPDGVPDDKARVRVVDLTGTDQDVSVIVRGRDGESVSARGARGEQAPYVRVEGRLPKILLGAELARRMSAKPGDEVTLISPLRGIDNRGLAPFGMAPSAGRFEVAGAFKSGFYDYDVRLTLVALPAAQRFLNRGDIAQWIDVRFDDVFQVKSRTERVRGAIDPFHLDSFVTASGQLGDKLMRAGGGKLEGLALESPPQGLTSYLKNVASVTHLMGSQDLSFGFSPSYKLLDWQEMNKNLFGALKLQKVVLTVFFLIIIVVAAFNVVGSQVMMIHEKQAEIGILKAMGATRRGVMRVFLVQGALVSGAGTAIGYSLGMGLCLAIDAVGYPLDPEVYLIDSLPVRIEFLQSALVAMLALLFTTVTTLYSAGRAAKLSPVQGLRYID